MNKPNARELINKASWTLMEGIKDSVTSNVNLAKRQGQLDISNETLVKLLSLLGLSVEEGFHKGSRVFSKVVDQAVLAAENPDPRSKKK